MAGSGAAPLNGATVSEIADPQQPESLSRLDIGMLMVLGAMAIAGLLGLIAVFDANSDIAALGIGFGVAWLLSLSGGTIACGLACLARRRLEIPALAAIAAAGLTVDLFALALVFDIESETYARLVGVAFVGAFFGLVVLGLALACTPREPLGRYLYVAAVAVAFAGAVIAWLLILTTDGQGEVAATRVPVDFANEGLLRPLAATFVLGAALWLATLAATRSERAERLDV